MIITYTECFKFILFGKNKSENNQNREKVKQTMYNLLEQKFSCQISSIKNGFEILDKYVTINYDDCYQAFLEAIKIVFYENDLYNIIMIFLEVKDDCRWFSI